VLELEEADEAELGEELELLELELEELDEAPAGGGSKLANSPAYAPSVVNIVVLVLAAVA
jgi:hypothetical protein